MAEKSDDGQMSPTSSIVAAAAADDNQATKCRSVVTGKHNPHSIENILSTTDNRSAITDVRHLEADTNSTKWSNGLRTISAREEAKLARGKINL
jgi:hypothetical protein